MPPKLPPYSGLHRTNVYQPSEDSFLLLDAIDAFAATTSTTPQLIVECGSGSGIVSAHLCRVFPAAQLLAVDLSPLAAEASQETLHVLNARAGRSDIARMRFFDNLRGGEQVDLVVFNPPYVPEEEGDCVDRQFVDLAWAGGPQGTDSTHPLVRAAHRVLKPQTGVLLLLLEKRNNIEQFLNEYKNLYTITQILDRKVAGEHLFVFSLTKR